MSGIYSDGSGPAPTSQIVWETNCDQVISQPLHSDKI